MNKVIKFKVITMFGWSLTVLLSIVFVSYNEYKYSQKLAYDIASANFAKDQAFRQWASTHGGVYVPVDMQRTPPSPYLSHIPERDITTPSGRKLTLMNPAYMLRQLIEEYDGLYGAEGHITALEVLNPASKPYPWEKKALEVFKKDKNIKEILDFATINNESYLRLIRPMKITKGCLNCHGHQKSYMGVSSAGGVSVSIPMKIFYANAYASVKKTFFIYAFVWLVGMILFHIVYKREHEAQKELEFYAQNDLLTSMPNRYAYNNKIKFMIQNIKEYETIHLLFMDLDNFKIINDTLGHTVGDLLLQGIAQRIKKHIGGFELCSRFGGDEFVLLFYGTQTHKYIDVVADQILAILKEPFILENSEVYATASIGVASYPKDASDAEELLKYADIAMYHAKKAGKSQYSFFRKEMIVESVNSLALDHDLHQALEKEELFLLYQPQICLLEEKLRGVEALIRWEHPTRGLISPFEFIPIAEQNGLILPIGEWIIQTACQTLQSWQDTDMKKVSLSINVSAKQLLHQNLYGILQENIKKYKIDSNLLELEITESVIMENIGETIILLVKLKELGLSIAIDDFGTGYSSLSYLKKLPVDKLKIDREFIKDIPEDKDDIAITKTIVSLAKSLGLKIIAEGPETEEHIAFLKEEKCDFAQGYYYSKPITNKELVSFQKTL